MNLALGGWDINEPPMRALSLVLCRAAVATEWIASSPPPAFTQEQSDAYSRFDLIVTALLDETYQHADQVYRNWTRASAAVLAVALAFFGGWSLVGSWEGFWWKPDMFLALLVGLLATPLAPIAKDISTALSTAVNTMQLVKK